MKHKKAKFKSCKSPKEYKHLKPRKYTFEVRTFDSTADDAGEAQVRDQEVAQRGPQKAESRPASRLRIAGQDLNL